MIFIEILILFLTQSIKTKVLTAQKNQLLEYLPWTEFKNNPSLEGEGYVPVSELTLKKFNYFLYTKSIMYKTNHKRSQTLLNFIDHMTGG